MPYILGTPHNTELAFKLASRTNLPSVYDLYIKQYQALSQSGHFTTRLQRLLRIHHWVFSGRRRRSRLSRLHLPLLVASSSRRANSTSSSPLSSHVLSCSSVASICWRSGWRRPSIVRLHDMTLALSVYLRANVPNKVVACFMETGIDRQDRSLLQEGRLHARLYVPLPARHEDEP